MSYTYPKDFQAIIHFLKKLPGIGERTAERFAFHLLNWPAASLKEFGGVLCQFQEKMNVCQECGCLKEKNCYFCENDLRKNNTVCIVSSARDVFAIEETKEFQGIYHVLDALLSPMEGKWEENLHPDKLMERMARYSIQEAILALDSTLEGDATSLFLREKLAEQKIKVYRIAFGLPVGSSLEYVDKGTLTRAFDGRQAF